MSSIDGSGRSEPIDKDRFSAQHDPPQRRIGGARRSLGRYRGDGRNLHANGEAASKATELTHVLPRVEAKVAALPHLAGVALVHRHGAGKRPLTLDKDSF